MPTALVCSAAPHGVRASVAAAATQSRGAFQCLFHGHISNGLPSLPRWLQ